MKFEKTFLKEVFQIGFPMIFAELSTILTIMAEVYLSNSLGVVGSSSYGIVSKLQSVFFIIGSSIKTLMTVVIGQFIGKKAFNELGRVMRNGLKLVAIPTALIAIFLIGCSRWFCMIFTRNEEVIQTSLNFLSIVGIAFVLIPLCQMMLGFVLGTGNTRFSFITLSSASILELILMFGIQFGYQKTLLAMGVSILAWYIMCILCCTIYYFLGNWKKDE